MPSAVKVETKDERTLTIPVGADASEVGNALVGLPEGYKLMSIYAHTSGQTDFVGRCRHFSVKLVFRRG
jgi:hypothetical protein